MYKIIATIEEGHLTLRVPREVRLKANLQDDNINVTTPRMAFEWSEIIKQELKANTHRETLINPYTYIIEIYYI